MSALRGKSFVAIQRKQETERGASYFRQRLVVCALHCAFINYYNDNVLQFFAAIYTVLIFFFFFFRFLLHLSFSRAGARAFRSLTHSLCIKLEARNIDYLFIKTRIEVCACVLLNHL